MEEIRQVALAYYYNFSEDERFEAYRAFREMDSNGDGTITIDEYEENFGTDHRNRFREVDMNGDGKLEFEEFITLYYLVHSGMVLCDGHGCKVNFLKGMYFTCVDCFNYSKTTTFDLCTSCYRNRNYRHDHTNFLDNHVLLRCKAAFVQDQPSYPEPNAVRGSVSKRPSYPEPYAVRRSVSKRPSSSDNQADEYESDEPSYPEPYAVRGSVSKRPSSSDNQAYESESDDQVYESESDEPSYPEPYAVRRSVSKRKVTMDVVRAVNAGVNLGHFIVDAAALCTIL